MKKFSAKKWMHARRISLTPAEVKAALKENYWRADGMVAPYVGAFACAPTDAGRMIEGWDTAAEIVRRVIRDTLGNAQENTDGANLGMSKVDLLQVIDFLKCEIGAAAEQLAVALRAIELQRTAVAAVAEMSHADEPESGVEK